MGFIQGLSAGNSQAGNRNFQVAIAPPMQTSYADIKPRPIVQMRGGGGAPKKEMNPAAIHQEAAAMVLRDKELDLQKKQVELEQLKEVNRQMKEVNRQTNESAGKAAIQKEYEEGIGRAKDWQGATDRQEKAWKDTQKAQKDTQREAYNKAMAGLLTGNGEAMKNFINQFGDPNTNVDDVVPSPDGKGGVIVVPAKGKDGKKKPSMAFDSFEQFHNAFGFFLHPDSEDIVKKGVKGAEGETKLSPDDISKIDERASKQWDEDNKDVVKGKITDAQAKDKQTFITNNRNNVIAQSAAASRSKGAIQGPKPVAGTGTEGAGQKDASQTFTDPGTGRKLVKFTDGGVDVYDKSGKFLGGKDATGKATTTPKAKEATFDYGTGRGGALGEGMPEQEQGAIEKPTPSENPEILDKYLHRKAGKTKQTGKTEEEKNMEFEKFVENQAEIPVKLKEVFRLMNEGKSGYDALSESFLNDDETRKKAESNSSDTSDEGY